MSEAPGSRRPHSLVTRLLIAQVAPLALFAVVVLAVGLGAFFIVGVRSLQTGLLRELSAEIAADAPDMFLVDVQRTQVKSVRAFLEDPTHHAGSFRLIPVLRRSEEHTSELQSH